MTSSRIYDRDPEHLRSDLADSLEAALGDWATPEQHDRTGVILASLAQSGDAQQALRDVLAAFGPPVFGVVVLFHIEARTSLMGDAEALTFARQLARLGLTVADLGWPADALNEQHAEAFRAWEPVELERFRSLVHRFRSQHGTAASGDLVGDLVALDRALADQRQPPQA
ncbi:hypothetical protein [Cellulosimicrobium sp. Marseille-Q4280]|uniref:hypothetical protein n=1 Tax=Cellulosimicrobium sp. Marseille-Q4280 TaxID=2937992 RepID=UPI002042616B|nr:hypothetical protein [Cellulosimicrobium sp. Marseille-Q4280]